MDFTDIGRLNTQTGKKPLLQTAPPHPQVLQVCSPTQDVFIPSRKNGRNPRRIDAAEDGFDMDWSKVQPEVGEIDQTIELLALIKDEGKNCISTLLHLLSKCKSYSPLFAWFLQCWLEAVNFLIWIR